MFVRPNPDKKVDGNPLQVWDPERNAFLPVKGAHVSETTYWYRRIADQDVVTTPYVEPAEETPAGSTVLPAVVDIAGTEVQQSAVVDAALKRSGKTVKQWNKMPAAKRETLLVAEVENMKAAAAGAGNAEA